MPKIATSTAGENLTWAVESVLYLGLANNIHEDSIQAMRIHYLQHVNFEGPAAIEDWVNGTGYTITGSQLFHGDALPEPRVFDLLVVLGGPMSVNDEQEYPWLAEEKTFLRRAIDANRAVLGICLGAQMIASALGARVYRAVEKEIGWLPVRRVKTDDVGALFPQSFTPLHWHGETFDLPIGAARLAETDAVPNQAFQLDNKVVGLQFHIEATPQSVQALIEHAAHEIQKDKPFQQTPQAILEQTCQASAAVRPILWKLLDHLAGSGA